MLNYTNAQMHKCSNAQMLNYTNVQMLKCSNAQMHRCSNAQMLKCANGQMHKRSNAQMPKCPNAQMLTREPTTVQTHPSVSSRPSLQWNSLRIRRINERKQKKVSACKHRCTNQNRSCTTKTNSQSAIPTFKT